MEVNKFHVPDFRLDPDLIDATKLLYDTYRNEEATDNQTISNLLGHKSPSGSYFRKLAALRDFGLIEKRGVKITNLGVRITYPTSDEEKNAALKEAILNIPLWKEFFNQYGINLPKDKFWVHLQRIAGLAAPDAQTLENPVRSAYLHDVRNLKFVSNPINPESDQTKLGDAGTNNRIPPVEQTGSNIPPIIPANHPKAADPYLYDPDLPAPIVITNVKTYKAAKIFWEAIAEKWEKIIDEGKVTGDKNPKDKEPTPHQES